MHRLEATVLFCKDCVEGKGDLCSPASRLAFAGDALARLTRDGLPGLPGLLATPCWQRLVSSANGNRHGVLIWFD